MIVTDHAPHSEEEKAKPMAQAPSGITGLETSLALGIYSLVEPGYITLMDLMKLMSKNPAEFYRMVPGSVESEAPADLVIFGEKEQWTVDHFCLLYTSICHRWRRVQSRPSHPGLHKEILSQIYLPRLPRRKICAGNTW